jgi:hypothetical protein
MPSRSANATCDDLRRASSVACARPGPTSTTVIPRWSSVPRGRTPRLASIRRRTTEAVRPRNLTSSRRPSATRRSERDRRERLVPVRATAAEVELGRADRRWGETGVPAAAPDAQSAVRREAENRDDSETRARCPPGAADRRIQPGSARARSWASPLRAPPERGSGWIASCRRGASAGSRHASPNTR